MKKTLTVAFTFLFVVALASNSFAQNSKGFGELLEKAKEKIEDLVDEVAEKLETKIKEAKKIVEMVLKELKEKMEGKKKEQAPQPYRDRGYYYEDNFEKKIKYEMGVKLFELSPKTREMLNLGDKGLIVVRVDSKSQADGVLKVGDILLTADGKKLAKIQDLVKIIMGKKKSNSIKLKFMRENKEKQIVFKLKEKESQTKPDKEKKPKKRKKFTEKELDEKLEEFYKEGDKEDPESDD
ncbi:MAG: PDZ domain-containing protein [Planctomycetes bacterium]|nr:PDZ domain-containing protein [Planctomycetota bacterium]